jgi:hypothetical protein
MLRTLYSLYYILTMTTTRFIENKGVSVLKIKRNFGKRKERYNLMRWTVFPI